MLNANTDKKVYITKALTGLEYMCIVSPAINLVEKCFVIITYITEEEEHKLDNNEPICISRKIRRVFNIAPEDCYGYGELDLSPNSNDMKSIIKLEWFDKLFDSEIWIPSGYDYETHQIYSEKPTPLWHGSRDVSEYLSYFHGCIGKPKRVVIFKERMNKDAIEAIYSNKQLSLFDDNSELSKDKVKDVEINNNNKETKDTKKETKKEKKEQKEKKKIEDKKKKLSKLTLKINNK